MYRKHGIATIPCAKTYGIPTIYDYYHIQKHGITIVNIKKYITIVNIQENMVLSISYEKKKRY